MKKIKAVLNFGIGHSIKNFPVVSFDATAGTITNIIGFVNEHEADINVKVLQNIRSKSIGIWNTATPENPSMVSGAGSYVFKVVEMVQFEAYTKATRTASADLKKLEKKVEINRTGSEVARTEVEQLDQAIIQDAETFTSFLARSHGDSMTALLDAHYIDLAVETAKLDKANREIINADWANLDTAVKRENAFRQTARALTGVSRQLNKYNLGSNPEEYATFLHMDVINDLLLAMPKGGDTATGIGRELATQLGASIIAGLGLVKDHVYLGQTIAKGTSFSKDTDFDFSKVFGVMAHKEALFLAINGLTTRATVDPLSGNDILITKFNYFKGAVRPELLRVFRTVASA